MWQKIVTGIAIAVLTAGVAFPREGGPSGASKRLKEAWNLKKTSFKQEAEVKKTILLKTVECYRSLLKEFPEAKAECSQACFRMGEIYRSLKMTEEALREFNRSITFIPAGEFAARSLKEIGHIHRRVKQYDKAIMCYTRVLDECPEQRDQCADAYTWTGKVHLKRKEYEKARGLFIGFIEKFPEFPDDGVRNIDLAAGSLLNEGKREEATALINKWRQHFESLLGKDKRLDKKIERALERMKTPERLKE
jgi:tetratricopeptide (TPR) repeat protein